MTGEIRSNLGIAVAMLPHVLSINGWILPKMRKDEIIFSSELISVITIYNENIRK
jgi:hypothetical protein